MEGNGPKFSVDSRAKLVDSTEWYRKFVDVGLGYGPSFQGLTNIRAHASENVATADVALHTTRDLVKGGESSYTLHPATLDTCLQLALIACHAGQIDKMRTAFVPIVADDLTVWIPNAEDRDAGFGYGKGSGQLRGLRGAYASTQLFGKSGAVLMDLKQLRCVSYDVTAGAIKSASARSPYLRLAWKPDINSLTNGQARAMFPPISDINVFSPIFDKFDQLAAYILVQIFKVSSNLFEEEQPQHLQMFLDWVSRCIQSAEANLLPYGKEALGSSVAERDTVIDRLSVELDDIVEAKLIKRIYNSLPQIFSGETSGLHVALKDNLLTELYVSGVGIACGYPQLLRAVDLLVHKSPSMKILEIGAGTGGATRQVMKALAGNTQHKRYQEYCFTDVTTSFLSAAQEEFAECKGVEFKTLDIEKDPLEQGFKPEFDLIIASQVSY